MVSVEQLAGLARKPSQWEKRGLASLEALMDFLREHMQTTGKEKVQDPHEATFPCQSFEYVICWLYWRIKLVLRRDYPLDS